MHTYTVYIYICLILCLVYSPPPTPYGMGLPPNPTPYPHRKAIHIHRQIHLHTVYLHIHIIHTYMHMHPCMCIYILTYIIYFIFTYFNTINIIYICIYCHVLEKSDIIICIIWPSPSWGEGGPPDTGHCMGPRWSTKPSRTSSRSWRIGQRRCPCRRAVSVPWPHGGPPYVCCYFFSNVFNYTKKYV